MALTLRGCREEAGAPAFGLCSTVHGEFEPTDKEKIISVVAKVCAHISQASPPFSNPGSARGSYHNQNPFPDIFDLTSFEGMYLVGK